MKFSDVPLPSNRSFGLFFTGVFAVVAAYFVWHGEMVWFGAWAAVAALCLSVTLLKAELLRPFNKAWMMLGLLLGMIVSPIVLGILFFGLFAPLAMVTRSFGRDELRLKRPASASFWRQRTQDANVQASFKHQF